jgi:peptidoglycan/xylan/chitin deacetylase (PgdA/CDA1 family)
MRRRFRLGRLRPATLLAVAGLLASATATGAAGTPPLPKVHTEVAGDPTPLDLVSASFGQVGRDVRLVLKTAKPFLATDLVPGSGRSLCVQLRVDADKIPDERLCAIASAQAASGLRMRLTHLDAGGDPAGVRDLKAKVVRPDGRTISASIPYASIGLKDGRHAWQAVSHWQDRDACRAVTPGVPPCVDRLPDSAPILFRLAPLKVVGCAYHGPAEFRGGSGNRVALTFDDGPAAITSQFLDVLEREHVPATFFVLGNQIGGRAALLRRMLADGDMIGNHSYDHADLGAGGAAAASEISRTQEIVRQATGFTPCLFRPPYGSTSASLVATAGAQQLTTTLWNVDPADWSDPGTGAIESRVLEQVRPGSIIIDHDGGGPRGQTLAALPHIIHELKRRGYRLVTVNELLGLKVVRR